MGIKTMQHIGLDGHIGPWNDRSLQSNASFRRHVTFANCLPVDIAVATRDGLRFTIDKRCMIGENKLIIRVETYVDSNIKKQLIALINSQDIENSVELQVAKTYWTNMSTSSVTGYNTDVMRIEYSIPLSLIKKMGGTVYIKDIDYLLSIHGVTDTFIHPYSHAGEIIKGSHDSLKDNLSQSDSGEKLTTSSSNFIRSIKIIDNEGIIGDRYIKMGGDIYAVRPHKDHGMRSGIYVLTNKPVQNELEKSEVVGERYDVCDTIPYFKLHLSYLEALNDEVSSEMRKAELAIQELQTREEETRNRTKRAELDVERLVLERDNFQRELEISKIKHENDVEYLRNKIETMREERNIAVIKEEEERKILKRKAFIETIRAIPVVVTGVLGLYAFYKKLNTPIIKL
jgi:hypothetical protein